VQVILTFATTHHALAAENVLLMRKLWHEMLPTPRDLTLSCGLSLLVRGADYLDVRNILTDAHVDLAGAYRMPTRMGDPFISLMAESP